MNYLKHWLQMRIADARERVLTLEQDLTLVETVEQNVKETARLRSRIELLEEHWRDQDKADDEE